MFITEVVEGERDGHRAFAKGLKVEEVRGSIGSKWDSPIHLFYMQQEVDRLYWGMSQG